MFCWKHRLRYARNERITEKKLTGRRRRQPPSFMDTHADVEWKSFSLTHVRYPSGDVIGFALAFISLAPFAIIVAFVTLIAFKKELDTVMFLLGQLTNEILNMVLKNVIREQRPAVTATHTPKSFGMPSSHSQFQSFFTVFAILFIVFRMKHKPDYFRFPIITALILSWFAVLYSRIYLMYHTWPQVVVGVMVGTCYACLFFHLVYNFIEPHHYSTILSLPISRFMGVTRYFPVKLKPQRNYK